MAGEEGTEKKENENKSKAYQVAKDGKMPAAATRICPRPANGPEKKWKGYTGEHREFVVATYDIAGWKGLRAVDASLGSRNCVLPCDLMLKRQQGALSVTFVTLVTFGY